MNKQFDKLMYDAGMIAQGCWDELDSYQRGAIEKFAELIILECAEVANHYDGADYIGREIKKHFGVEE